MLSTGCPVEMFYKQAVQYPNQHTVYKHELSRIVYVFRLSEMYLKTNTKRLHEKHDLSTIYGPSLWYKNKMYGGIYSNIYNQI